MPTDLKSDSPSAPGAASAAWLQHLCDLTETEGFMEPAGPGHHALHLEGGPDLLICFADLPGLSQRAPGDYPTSWKTAREAGWSLLVLISERDAWFRAPPLWEWLDARADEAFFENFDRVLFYGSGPAAHAACAFSAAAPGAFVLALSPVATLDPDLAGWDNRWPEMRRSDFRNRYGYGPDMLRAAARATLIHDPEIPEDAMHSALYRQNFVQRLKMPGAGRAPERILEDCGLLPSFLHGALEGSLSPATFARLWRQRRHSVSWLQGRAARAAGSEQPCREALVLAHALALSPDQPKLQRRYDLLTERYEEELAEARSRWKAAPR
ncbi:hypothetical protein [Falsigemmobacter faecalis]|uniref:Phosphoadenosine phosphosulfate reductase n=1 Tax=Falsigemmobacter faecalis TaxID=2488730 RepID=A0A3P3DHU9_9RHOB|nr:hypothetical protein [Falsigemmobacter faecalis]RRH73839.1 hypothetical protein EG244_12275 [Falsigemmobacter faecalis]